MNTTKSYKPANYTSLAPYLIMDGADKTIQFLKDVFDAELLRRFKNEHGGVGHAEVRIDDTVLMLGDNPPDCPTFPTGVHIYVPDVDATYQKALAAGAESVQEPVKKDDPDKRGGVKFLDMVYWIATTVEAE